MASKQALSLIIGAALLLVACKQNGKQETPAPEASNTPSAARSASSAPAVAATPVKTSGHDGQAKQAAFDISKVKITTTPLPPFPYLDWPDGLADGNWNEKNEDFDRGYVLAGDQVYPIEGRISRRRFNNQNAKLSRLGAERNYENALLALGATKTNTIESGTPEYERFEASKAFRQLDLYSGATYGAYLIRTPEKNVWFSVSINEGKTDIMVIDEQTMKQAVRPSEARASAPAP